MRPLLNICGLTCIRMQVEGVQPSIYRSEYSGKQSIVAAALFQSELALIVIRDDSGDLQVSALSVHANMRPSIESLGNPLPLSQYPNSISIVRQSDGSTYGIICAAESSFDRYSEFSKTSSVLSLSAIFKLDVVKGLLRVESPDDYWPLDQTSKSEPLNGVLDKIVHPLHLPSF